MRAATRSLAALAAALPTVLGHGYLTGAEVAGVWYPGFTVQMAYEHPHAPVYGWDTAALDSGFVSPSAFQSADIICHKNATPAALSVPIKAGQQITVYWISTWPEGHQGPVLDYLAECKNGDCSTVDKTTLNFAKIDQVGLVSGASPGVWGEDQLVQNNVSWTITIPPTLKAGAYVLRHEILALHGASQPNGAQAYPQCFNLQVSGGGSDTIVGESAEAFYKANDPGVLVDIYNNNAGTYQIPGPTVQAFGGSGGAAPTTTKASTTAAPTTTKASTTVAPTTTKASTTLATVTKAPTTTSAKPSSTTTSTAPAGSCAALYGQCGGSGWTGPTCCVSGTCKANGAYYSQCT